MISSVYSYYLTQYGNNFNAKYDFHSKKELKTTAGKLAKINSQAPSCKTDFSEAAQKYAIDLKENARRLNYIANDLSDSSTDTMTFKKSAQSSDSEQVNAEYIGSGDTPASLNFDISVEQLATSQVNTGNYLQPNSKLLQSGTYSFDLNINNLTYEFEFDVNKSETTNDIQNKISRLINRSNIGINSEVDSDSLGNTALVISSDATGIYGAKPTIFNIKATTDGNDTNTILESTSGSNSVSDESDAMIDGTTTSAASKKASANQNLVSTLGLSRISAFPKNAIFSINGEERFSQNNNITINKTFLLNLKQPTGDTPVNISLSNDSDSLVQSIGELVSGYNDLLSVAEKDDSMQFEGDKLKKEIHGIVSSYTDELQQSGLDISDTGEISVDNDAIKSVADEGRINDLFNSLGAFKKAIQQKAEYISLNPMSYVNNTIIAYKNPIRTTIDPYNLSVYSGMMLDGYI